MGIESAKMADIEMVDPLGWYFSFIQAHCIVLHSVACVAKIAKVSKG